MATQSGTAWADLAGGLGEEWDFESQGPLVARYLGTATQQVERKDRAGEPVMVDQTVYQFEPLDPAIAAETPIVFLWGSYQLDAAMTQIAPDGQTAIIPGQSAVRIAYLGEAMIRGGRQRLKRYRVQVASETPEEVAASLFGAQDA